MKLKEVLWRLHDSISLMRREWPLYGDFNDVDMKILEAKNEVYSDIATCISLLIDDLEEEEKKNDI